MPSDAKVESQQRADEYNASVKRAKEAEQTKETDKAKFQGFRSNENYKADEDAPKRESFEPGIVGNAAYTRAMTAYRNRGKRQSDALEQSAQ